MLALHFLLVQSMIIMLISIAELLMEKANNKNFIWKKLLEIMKEKWLEEVITITPAKVFQCPLMESFLENVKMDKENI